MSTNTTPRPDLSRRTVLRRGAILTTSLGLASMATVGTAAAKKAELIEAMASEAGISKSDAQGILDAISDTTTKALGEGDSAVLVGFGAFSISKRAARTGRNPQSAKGRDDSPVTFDACPEFAAALDLNPGKGDEASAKCRDADVVIDAASLARQLGRGSDSGLSKADAKRALDALVGQANKALKKGDRLSVSEAFGSFSISKRSARTGRNPQTGKEIQTAAKKVVTFKAGAELSKAVN